MLMWKDATPDKIWMDSAGRCTNVKEKCKLLTTIQSHNEKKYNIKEIKHIIVANENNV